MITNSKSGIVVLVATATSCVVLGLTATLTTVKNSYTVFPEGYYVIMGRSDVVVLFLTSCISVAVGLLLIVTSFVEDSTPILKSRYFQATHIVFFCLYLSSSIAVLANLDSIPRVPDINTPREMKDRAISAGVFGLASGLLHMLALLAQVIRRDAGDESIRIVQ